MPPIFPLEIEELILDLLAEGDASYSAIKTCSLVCQAFLPICRKHIFGSIFLNDYYCRKMPLSTIHAFARLLRGTPEIADYIRKLDYNLNILFTDLNSPSARESLKRISRLESLTVWQKGWPNVDWSNNPIRPSLLHLLHLPTLTHFTVDINDFVLSDLIPCVNLKYLRIGNNMEVAAKSTFPAALPELSIQLDELVADIMSPDAMMLCTARHPDGQPIFDFGSLSKIKVDLEGLNESEALQELFGRCHVLTKAHISFRNPRKFRPGLADLLRPSMQTLKHIVVDVDVDGDDVDPLFGIPSELDQMRSENIIETITIGILIKLDENCREGDDWGRLDEVLTTPGWFSLKRVSLTIENVCCGCCKYEDDEDELDIALRKLPETQFSRLSSSTSVSFDFEIINTVPFRSISQRCDA